MDTLITLRIDKWLWCARFFKTRSLAATEIGKNRVFINGQVCKASREVRCGDSVSFRQGAIARTVVVRGISNARGSAPVAQQLYEGEQAAEQRRLAPEPAHALTDGRPTKRDRRDIERVNALGNRWSASIEP